MKTIRSRKAVSNVLATIIVMIIVIIATVALAYAYYYEPGTRASDSKGPTTTTGPPAIATGPSAIATGPSVMGKSGSRDINPTSPPSQR